MSLPAELMENDFAGLIEDNLNLFYTEIYINPQ